MRNIFDILFVLIKKGRIAVVIGWLCILAVSIYFGPKFLSKLSIDFEAPKNSPGAEARKVLETNFPQRVTTGNLFILFQQQANQSILCEWTRNSTIFINQTAYEYNSQISGLVLSVEGYYMFDTSNDTWPENVTISLALRKIFVSENYRSTFVEITVSEREPTDIWKLVKYFRKVTIPSMDKQGGNFSVEVVGYDALLADINAGAAHDMEVMDSIALPLALLVVRSITLMVIPICTVLVATLSSFALMYPIALSWSVAAFCPSIMMSCIIAMSIDYSLFLLSRYREELSAGRTNEMAVRRMLRYSGQIVATSGGVLTICFLGLALFPLSIVASMGVEWTVAAALALVCTIVVNLTLTPSLMLLFPRFFAVNGILPCFKRCRQAPVLSADEVREREQNSLWFKSARITTTTRWSLLIIAIVVCCILPFIVVCKDIAWTLDNSQIIPRHCPAEIALDHMSEDFPPGLMYPYEVVATSSSSTVNSTVFCEEYFVLSQEAFQRVANRTNGVEYDHITSISTISGFSPSFLLAEILLDVSPLYGALYHTLVNSNGTATLTIVPTDFDPANRVQYLVNTVRDVLDNYSDPSSFEFYLTNGMVDENDAVVATMHMFPIMIAATASIVILMLMIIFRSAFLPIRILVTIGLTLGWIYGFATMVFCYKWFDWITPNLSESNDLYWIVPIMSFSVLVGLALDYDIFLFSRIVEYRRLGYGTRASVIKGMHHTGGIITFAGIIMAIAFMGLMFAQEMALNQFGFFLSFAVLLDTFVIRTLLNPAIMHLSGELNWWPQRLDTLWNDPSAGDDLEESESNPLIQSPNIQ